jgi:hypothetical protein
MQFVATFDLDPTEVPLGEEGRGQPEAAQTGDRFAYNF